MISQMQRARITMFAPTGRADLAVPTAVPLALLLPLLFDQLRLKGNAKSEAWEIARAGGQPLDREASLDDADVVDGDMLFMQRSATDEPVLYDDLAEVIGEHSISAEWTAKYTRAAAIVGAVLTGALALIGTVLTYASPYRAAICMVVVCALVTAAAVLSRMTGECEIAVVASGLAVLWAAVAGNSLGGGALDGPGVLGGSVATGAVSLLVAPVLKEARPVAYAGGALASMAAVAGIVLAVSGDRRVLAAAIVGVVAQVSMIAAPNVALRFAGVSAMGSMPERERSEEVLRLDEFSDTGIDIEVARARVEYARCVVFGVLTGFCAALSCATVVLATSADTSAHALAVVLVTLMLLRGRMFRDRGYVAVLVIAGLFGLAAVAVAALFRWRNAGWHIPTIGLLGVICFVIAFASVREWCMPRVHRVLDVADIILQVSAIPVVLAIGGAYGAILDIWN